MLTIELKIQNQNKNHLLACIEEASGVPRELWEVKRSKDMTEVMLRQIYMYMLVEKLKMRTQQTANLVGLKAHSTVLLAINRVNSWKENPEKYEIELQILNKTIELYEQRNS